MFRAHSDLLKVAEIEPQTQWIKGTAPDARPRGSPIRLRELASLPQRKLLHGVGYPVGATVCDQSAHVGELRRWADQLAAPWTSEHLSVLEIPAADRPRSCGFLMPPLQTDAAVALIVANIKARTAAIGLPFAFETGVNYFAPRPGEMPDGDFFATIAHQAGCGILLDLSNLWVNARNGRASLDDVLRRLPLEQIWEIHLAGSAFAHDHWLDAHCGAIHPEVVAFATDIVPHVPNLGAIVFELAPDRVATFGESAFLNQIETLHRIWDRRLPSATIVPRAPPDRRGSATTWTQAAWETAIGERLLPPAFRRPDPAAIPPLSPTDERSFALYARLIESFRCGALTDLLNNTIRLLLRALGRDALGALLHDYVVSTSPALFPADEALQFRHFVEQRGLPIPGLADIVQFESAPVQAIADSVTVRVTLSRDIGRLLDDIAADRIPHPDPDETPTTLEIGADPDPFVRIVAPAG